jgi:hypothetical protein
VQPGIPIAATGQSWKRRLAILKLPGDFFAAHCRDAATLFSASAGPANPPGPPARAFPGQIPAGQTPQQPRALAVAIILAGVVIIKRSKEMFRESVQPEFRSWQGRRAAPSPRRNRRGTNADRTCVVAQFLPTALRGRGQRSALSLPRWPHSTSEFGLSAGRR